MNSSTSEHYLFISSTDSSDYFPFNITCDFHIELPEIIFLTGTWSCSLLQIGFKDEIVDDIIVFCDLCNSSFVRDTRLPVLRFISQSSERSYEFSQPQRISISRDEIKRLRIFIRTASSNEIPSFINNPVTCTLHLRRE